MARVQNLWEGQTPIETHVFDPSVYLSAYPKNLPTWEEENQLKLAQMPGQNLAQLGQTLANLPTQISEQKRTLLANQMASTFEQRALAGQGPPFKMTLKPGGPEFETQLTPGQIAVGRGQPLAGPPKLGTPKKDVPPSQNLNPSGDQSDQTPPQQPDNSTAPPPPPRVNVNPNQTNISTPDYSRQLAQFNVPSKGGSTAGLSASTDSGMSDSGGADSGDTDSGDTDSGDTGTDHEFVFKKSDLPSPGPEGAPSGTFLNPATGNYEPLQTQAPDTTAAPAARASVQPPAAAYTPQTSVAAAVPSLRALSMAQAPSKPDYPPLAPPQQTTGQQIFNAYKSTISPDAKSWNAELTPDGQRTGRIIIQHRTDPTTKQPVLPDQPVDPQWAAANLLGTAPRQVHPAIAGDQDPTAAHAIARGQSSLQNVPGPGINATGPIANPSIIPGQVQNVPGPSINVPRGPVIPPGPQIAAVPPVVNAPGTAPQGAVAAQPIQNVPGPSINLPRGPVIPVGANLAAQPIRNVPGPGMNIAGPAVNAPVAPGPAIAAAPPIQNIPGPGINVPRPIPQNGQYVPQIQPDLAGFNPQIPTTPAGIIAAGGGPEALTAQAAQATPRGRNRTGAPPRVQTQATPQPSPGRTPVVTPNPGGTPITTLPTRPNTPDHDADGNPTPKPGSTEYWSQTIGAKNPKDFGLVTTNPQIHITATGKTDPDLNGVRSDYYDYTASDGYQYRMYVDPSVGGVDANGNAVVNPASQYSKIVLSPFSEERTYTNGANAVIHNPLAENVRGTVYGLIVEQGLSDHPERMNDQQLEAAYLEAMQKKLTTVMPTDLQNESMSLQKVYQLTNKMQSIIQHVPPLAREENMQKLNDWIASEGAAIPDWMAGPIKAATGGKLDIQHANQFELDTRALYDQIVTAVGQLPEFQKKDPETIKQAIGQYKQSGFPTRLWQFVHGNVVPDSGRLLDHATSMGFKVPRDLKNMTMAGQFGTDRPGGTDTNPLNYTDRKQIDEAIPQTFFKDREGNIIYKNEDGRVVPFSNIPRA